MTDKVTAGTTLSGFRRAVEDSLKAQVGRLGATGEGVFVSSLAAASAMSFDALWMVGMIEGKTAALRSALTPCFRNRICVEPEGGRGRSTRWPRSATTTCRRSRVRPRVPCRTRRSMPPREQGHIPSRWFLEQATALERRPVHTSDIGDLRESPLADGRGVGHTRPVGCGERALADTHDYNLARLLNWQNSGGVPARHPLALDGPLDRAARMGRDRRLGRLTEFDGNLSSVAATSRFRENLDRSAVSATSLESWAACPFRYFLGHVLRLGMVETPEEIMTISPLERGSLVHKILERFIRDAEDKGAFAGAGRGMEHAGPRPHHGDRQPGVRSRRGAGRYG